MSGIFKIYAITIPGRTAWEMASPINDQPFRTRKHDKIDAGIEIKIAIIRAFSINPY